MQVCVKISLQESCVRIEGFSLAMRVEAMHGSGMTRSDLECSFGLVKQNVVCSIGEDGQSFGVASASDCLPRLPGHSLVPTALDPGNSRCPAFFLCTFGASFVKCSIDFKLYHELLLSQAVLTKMDGFRMCGYKAASHGGLVWFVFL